MSSEIRDKVIGDLGNILGQYELMMGQDKPRLSLTIEAILSNEHIAIVDRDAPLPPENNKCILWDLYQKGWLESQQTMRINGWVKEEK